MEEGCGGSIHCSHPSKGSHLEPSGFFSFPGKQKAETLVVDQDPQLKGLNRQTGASDMWLSFHETPVECASRQVGSQSIISGADI